MRRRIKIHSPFYHVIVKINSPDDAFTKGEEGIAAELNTSDKYDFVVTLPGLMVREFEGYMFRATRRFYMTRDMVQIISKQRSDSDKTINVTTIGDLDSSTKTLIKDKMRK